MSTDRPRTDAESEWTWMVYLAGDNNLENYSTKDLLEMKRTGSTAVVNLVAQVDRMSDKGTRRYHLTNEGDLQKDIVELLPETNCGDPQVLLDFIFWAIEKYPAKHYALILWNHGSGWKEDDIYKSTQRIGMERVISRGAIRGITAGNTGRALFSTTLDQLVFDAGIRGIAYDDSDADFLDNAELKAVLQKFASKTKRKIDLLGFDACLMNMLEVVYQVRGECNVVTGSQEVEPGDGWPYDSILSSLIKDPFMTAETLGKMIVDKYIQYYEQHQPDLAITQSAIMINRLDPLVKCINTLAMTLLASLGDTATLGKIFQALRYAQSFSDRDYLDLGHFCQVLSEGDQQGELGFVANNVLQVILGEKSPVLATRSRGSTMQHATGLSIYLPARVLSPLYNHLDFAKDNLWDEFLGKFIHPKG